MKKAIYLIILSSIVLFSCKKDEKTVKTSYQIINNNEFISSTVQYFNGTLWEVVIFCFNGDEVIRQDNIKSITYGGGKSDIKEIECDKVKVSFQMLPTESPNYDLSLNDRVFTVVTFPLIKGQNNEIVLDGKTMIQNHLKSGNLQSFFKTIPRP